MARTTSVAENHHLDCSSSHTALTSRLLKKRIDFLLYLAMIVFFSISSAKDSVFYWYFHRQKSTFPVMRSTISGKDTPLTMGTPQCSRLRLPLRRIFPHSTGNKGEAGVKTTLIRMSAHFVVSNYQKNVLYVNRILFLCVFLRDVVPALLSLQSDRFHKHMEWFVVKRAISV